MLMAVTRGDDSDVTIPTVSEVLKAYKHNLTAEDVMKNEEEQKKTVKVESEVIKVNQEKGRTLDRIHSFAKKSASIIVTPIRYFIY